jgi:uncharacterized Zn-binding protein involved in type VI secretion
MSTGKGVVRDGLDRHYGHASPTPNPFHKTPYRSSLQDKVLVEGRKAIVKGDSTACGDGAVGASNKVFIKGIGVHRILDGTSGHGSWVPNAAQSGSAKVLAGG